MPSPYEILGIAMDSDDSAIRKRYLELTRRFNPETHPERFAAIRDAYERIKDLTQRATSRLFDTMKDDSLAALIETVESQRNNRRVTLRDLLHASGSSHS